MNNCNISHLLLHISETVNRTAFSWLKKANIQANNFMYAIKKKLQLCRYINHSLHAVFFYNARFNLTYEWWQWNSLSDDGLKLNIYENVI